MDADYAHEGLPALLLEGPPGAGKSALAGAVARATGRRLIVYQAHAWSDADELFVGVDVGSAVAGEAASVRQDGVLAVAARASHEGAGCVLLIDELDKAQERAEALLLDWLQSGRVPVAPGRHLSTRPSGCLVLITSNAAREHSAALADRVGRVWMDPLPVEVQVRLMAERSGHPEGLVRALWAVARDTAAADGAAVSLRGGLRIMAGLALLEQVADLRHLVAVHAAHGPKGRALVRADARINSLWGVLRSGGARAAA